MREMILIRSDKHDLYSIKVNKTALSSNDDKRVIDKNKIHTHALREQNWFKDKKNTK